MSPTTAAATKGWEGMTTAQRVLRLNMLDSVDPAAAKEARGYMEAGFFGDAPKGGNPHAAPDIDSVDTRQVQAAPDRQTGNVNKPERPGFVKSTLERAKELILQNPSLASAAGAALVPPPFNLAAQGANIAATAKTALREGTAKDVKADEANRLKGTMEAPGGLPQQEPPLNLVSEMSGSGGGPQVLEAGIGTLNSSGTQTTQVEEGSEAAALRTHGFGLAQQAADERLAADQKAAKELLDVAKDREMTNERFRVIEQERAREEAQVRADNEARIAAAEKAFQEAEPDPKWNPYREIANGSWDQKIMLGLGSLLGGMGAAMTKGPNYFLEAFNAQIQRRLQALRELRQHRGEVVKQAGNAYTRALEALGSKRALDLMEESRMWKQLGLQVETVAAQRGLDSTHPAYLELRSGIALKERELLMQAARQITKTSQSQQAFRPMMALGGSGGGKDPLAEALDNIGKWREEKKLPQIEGALNNMFRGIQGFAQDPSLRDQIAVWLATGQSSPMLVQLFVKNPGALQSFLAGYGTYREALGGKSLTASEIQAVHQQVASGDLRSLWQFYQDVETIRNSLESDVRSRAPQAYELFSHNKKQTLSTPNAASSYQPGGKPLVGGAPVSK